MRASFNARTRECMTDLGASPDNVRAIVDLGAASGKFVPPHTRIGQVAAPGDIAMHLDSDLTETL
jgi:hypothetical protein